jgi:hypothetical protein
MSAPRGHEPMREIDNVDPPPPLPDGEPLKEWRVAAIGPGWRPMPWENELLSVSGRLQLYPEALVFRADDVIDRSTGEPVVGLVPADAVAHAHPLAPGSTLAASETAGQWMPAPLRRFRCPGFVVGTADGPWVFDCPKGYRRAEEISRRYG